MVMGGIPGNVRVKWRRVRDRGARAGLLRLQTEKLEDERGNGRAHDCPQRREDSWPGRRCSCSQAILLKAPLKKSLAAESQSENS